MKETTYNKAIGDYICGEIAGGNSLRSIMRRPGMPELRTWFRWLRTIDGLRQQYEDACEDRAYLFTEEIMEIADDGSGDTITKVGKDGREYTALDTEWLGRSKLKVDARKWVASRLLPKYRDRQDLTSSDGSLSPQPVVKVERVIVRPDPQPADE